MKTKLTWVILISAGMLNSIAEDFYKVSFEQSLGSSGNANYSTSLTPSHNYFIYDDNCVQGKCVKNTSAEILELSINNFTTFENSFSISLWLNLGDQPIENSTAKHFLRHNTDAGGANIYLRALGQINADGTPKSPHVQNFMGVTGSPNYVHNGYWADVVDNAWHHYVFTYDNTSNGRRKLYVDGVLISNYELPSQTNRVHATNPMIFYVYANNAIDEIQFFNEDISMEAVQQLFSLKPVVMYDVTNFNVKEQVQANRILASEMQATNLVITPELSIKIPDYVFEPGYSLQSLKETQKFVKEHKHLPDVPSGSEMSKGVDLFQLNMALLKKVEELTLHAIRQEDRMDSLSERMQILAEKNAYLENVGHKNEQ